MKNNQEEEQENNYVIIEFIQKTVREHFGVSFDAFNSNSWKREVVMSRQISIYLSKIYTTANNLEIGNLHGRDQANVNCAYKTTRNLVQLYPEIRTDVNNLINLMGLDDKGKWHS
jgi:chromosomal replication initiator protein